MIKQAEVTTAEVLKRAQDIVGLNEEQAEKLRIIMMGMQVFKDNLRWDPVVLSRTLLGAGGLTARQVSYIMGIDTGDVNSNNNPRVTLGDTPKKVLSFKDLKSNPMYNKKLLPEEFELLKLQYPRIEEFRDDLIDHQATSMVA